MILSKLTKIFENEGVTAKKIADYDTPDTELDTERAKPKVAIAGTMCQIQQAPSELSEGAYELAIEAGQRRL